MRWLGLDDVTHQVTYGARCAVRLCAAAEPSPLPLPAQGLLGLGSCDRAPEFRLVPSKHYPERGFNLAVHDGATGAVQGL